MIKPAIFYGFPMLNLGPKCRDPNVGTQLEGPKCPGTQMSGTQMSVDPNGGTQMSGTQMSVDPNVGTQMSPRRKCGRRGR